MSHDVNWPSRVAKRVGIRKLFGVGPGRPNPGDVSAETRARLALRYRDDVERLEHLLDRSLWPSGRAPARPQAGERGARRPA